MEHISDLFGNDRFVGKKGKPTSERASIIQYFTEQLKREPKVVAIRMAHFSLDQLYALKSSYDDRLRRQDRDTALKYLWFASRTKKE